MSESGRGISWDEVRNRIEESQRSLEKALSANEDFLEGIYRERAVQLADRQAQNVARSTLRVLEFTLGTERYALEFNDLVELLPLTQYTRVPGAPAQMLGVINVHGEIRCVVDLGRLLELPDRHNDQGGYVLLLRKQGREAAWRVDEIVNLVHLETDHLAMMEESQAGAALRYLRGLTQTKIRLLNTEAILAHPIYQGADK